MFDFVGAGVVQLVALEVNFGAAKFTGKAFGEIQRAWAANVVARIVVELTLEIGVVAVLLVGAPHFQHQRHQRLGDKAAAENTEMPALVRAGAVGFRRVGLPGCAHRD